MHLVRQPVDLSAGVAENDSLSDRDRLVKISERIRLPLFLFHGNVELLDTFERQFISLDENSDRITHELLGDLEDIGGHGSRKKDNLGVLGEELEDLVNLVLETTRQHFIGLVETEDLDVVSSESTTVDHVLDTTGGTDNDLDTLLELGHIFTDVGTTNASVALDVHVITESDDNLLDLLGKLTGGGEDKSLSTLDVRVELLEDGNREGSGFSGTRLSLSDDIVSLDDGDNSTLLNSGGTLETSIFISS